MWKGVTICELLHFKCTCGNCNCKLVTNISEWYCCKEIEGCCGVLTNEIVWNDFEEGEELHCISKHLGLKPVCLKKGSLSLVSGKYRTRVKQAYKKNWIRGKVQWIFSLSFQSLLLTHLGYHQKYPWNQLERKEQVLFTYVKALLVKSMICLFVSMLHLCFLVWGCEPFQMSDSKMSLWTYCFKSTMTGIECCQGTSHKFLLSQVEHVLNIFVCLCFVAVIYLLL